MLSLHGELHRQRLQHLAAETVDDKRHRLLLVHAQPNQLAQAAARRDVGGLELLPGEQQLLLRGKGNIFDLIIVGIALLPATGSLSVLRALRILRVLRLVSAVPSMRSVSSMPGTKKIRPTFGLAMMFFLA